ncbi:hypothetical protein M413DRAFT_21301 [Hebeloma cylindrosporum]|uniref:Uncharacterized protein n=1 Tax=Hebeloma cylindrosporum TaxID=76867 RepID=A0A0C3CYT4_HEBCY|nr:hypothetical protein M413DRAFT_21301 [Hebeloma cylindrosporum h7]
MAAPVSAQAMENNQRLFLRYAKVFRENDVAAYTLHAHKLAVWLRDSKAYYAAARPEIVKLLLIAQISLRRALGFEQEFTTPFNITNYPRNPMIDAYSHLVGTVEPYLPLFVEPALFEHIAGLVATIHPPALPDSLSQTTTSLVSPPTFGDMPMTVSAGIAPSTSAPPHINTSFFDPDVQIIDNPYASISTLVPMNNPNQPAGSSSAAKPVETTLKAKAKKRKSVVDFSVLAQRDIEGLMQKKQATQYPIQKVKTMSPPVVIPPEPLALPPSSNPLKRSPEPFPPVAGQNLVAHHRATPPPFEIVVQPSPSDKPMDMDASTQMNVDEVMQTKRLDQPSEGQKDLHEPADKPWNDENLPTNIEEAGERIDQPEVRTNGQRTPEVETDHSLSIPPATKTPTIQRLPSVPPEKESNGMDLDINTVLLTSSTGTRTPPTTMNGTQVYNLPQSPSTSNSSPGENHSSMSDETNLFLG